ncbi:hypothetical protein JCM10450v2_008251 [Rhodotorula kratochvilovae]
MSTGTTRPRTTINDLPYELKRYIAQLCADEDERFDTLFVVSREWAELVAPFRFTTLKHSKATSSDDTVLRERIVPLRLEHVKEHDLRDTPADIVLAAIPLIGPAARALKLDEASLEVLGDALNLHIEATKPSMVVAALHYIISAPPHLQHVAVSITGTIPLDLMEIQGSIPVEKRSALRSFVFEAPYLPTTLLDLVSRASRLEKLSLSVTDPQVVSLPFPPGVTFANLGDLTLGGAFSFLVPLLDSAQASTFPRLLYLKLLIERVVMNSRSRCPLHKLDKLLLPSSLPHPTLSSIHLFNPMRMFAPRELDYLERIARTRYAAYDILLTPERLFPSRALMFDAGWHATRSAASTARAARDVKRTVAFLQRWCDRIDADGNVDGTEMGRLAELLTTAEFTQVPLGAPSAAMQPTRKINVFVHFVNELELTALSTNYEEAEQAIRDRFEVGDDKAVEFFREFAVGWARIAPSAWTEQLESERGTPVYRVQRTSLRKAVSPSIGSATGGADASSAHESPAHKLPAKRKRGDSEESVTFQVKTLTGKTYPLTAFQHSKAEHVKLLLERLDGTPSEQQRLIFAGRALKDDRTLDSIGIEDGATMLMALTLRGGKPVIYLFPPAHLPSATVSLSLPPEWDVSALYPVVNVKKDERGRPRVEWTVSAAPDGSLVELSSGLELKYLFWEATTTGRTSSWTPEPSFHPSSPSLDRTNGVILPFNPFLAHLDAALARLSLHTAARNDFLTYWMAHFTRIRDAGQQVVFRFVPQAEFARAAELEVEPRPDVVTRAFLLFKGVDAGAASEGWRSAEQVDWVREVGIEEEKVRDESLFRVLEWGGMEVV